MRVLPPDFTRGGGEGIHSQESLALDLLDGITKILAAPIVGDLDLMHLFLLVGVVIVAIGVWLLILHSLTDAAEAAV